MARVADAMAKDFQEMADKRAKNLEAGRKVMTKVEIKKYLPDTGRKFLLGNLPKGAIFSGTLCSTLNEAEGIKGTFIVVDDEFVYNIPTQSLEGSDPSDVIDNYEYVGYLSVEEESNE